MIVNPQLFNYRLIIGSLLVVLTVLGVYSYNNYQSVESYEQFLKQEKVLIETELSELLLGYEDLSQDYEFMALELKAAKLETQKTLDSLRILKSELSIVSKFKNQLLVLKSKSKLLLGTIDSLSLANEKLQNDKRYALKTIQNKTSTINNLEEINASLNRTIDNASLLNAVSINARPYKLKSGKKKFTDRARRANAIDVCVTLTENPLALNGRKDIYIQIVGPDGNVVADKGEVVFGNSSLIYSNKKTVDYNNESMEICAQVVTGDDDKPFEKGYYFVHVFHKERSLGSTNIELK